MRVRPLIVLVSSIAASVTALAACGGGGASSSTQQGEPSSSGQETAAELEGFDTEGFEDVEPTVDHGQGSARELLGIHPPPEPWDSMSYADQEMYMVAYVLPIHAEIFAEHDPEEYGGGRFVCETCHGDDGQQRNWEMPSRSLPPLPPEGSERWNAAAERDPEAWRFMTDVVTPVMRTQLGKPEMTCFGCHPASTR